MNYNLCPENEGKKLYKGAIIEGILTFLINSKLRKISEKELIAQKLCTEKELRLFPEIREIIKENNLKFDKMRRF